MTEGVSSPLRFLMVAWTWVTLLVATGCGSPVSNDEGTTEPAIVPLKGVRAELVADVTRAMPGDSFGVGVLLTIPKGSHIYWKNPGASGLASGVEWTMPDQDTVWLALHYERRQDVGWNRWGQ